MYPRIDIGAIINAFNALVIFLSEAAREPINLFNIKNNNHRIMNNINMEVFTRINVGKD